MKQRMISVLLSAFMLLAIMSGCDLKNPVETTGAGDSTIPTHSSEATDSASDPTNAPSIDSSLPEDAVVQEDGNYVRTQYVNAMGTETEQSKAEYVTTTVYSPDARVLSVEQVSVKTGHVSQVLSYEYDGDQLSCVNSQYFDKNGNFRMHYAEYFASNGALSKRVDFDPDGSINKVTQYSYFDDGTLQAECGYDNHGTMTYRKEYDARKRLVSEQRWHSNGQLNEECIYTNGVLIVKTTFDEAGNMTWFMEYWPNGNPRTRKSIGFFHNDELIPGWCLYEFDENGVSIHDLCSWPDGTVFSEFYYYPSGNIKSQYYRDPSNAHNPENYAEFYDGMIEPYGGWNIIDGEKIYFGKAQQEQNPDKVYDDRGNLIQYTETENGYTYEVYLTYDDENRKLTKECIGSDGSRAYTEYAYTDQTGEAVYSEHTGKFCKEEGVIRYIFDMRSGMYRYEWFYADGSYTLSIDSASGKPYYLTYLYADGRKEIYEYDEGEPTYTYIECEDGSVIEKGTPRG